MKIVEDAHSVSYLDEHGNIVAKITFPFREKNIVDINSTFVDDSLRGEGIASKLVQHAYEKIKANNFKAVATCSYAVKWFEKNKDKNDILIDYNKIS